MVVDNPLWDAMENRRDFLQPQTDLRRRSASDVPGRDVSRDPDESKRLQYADSDGGLSEGAADTGRGTTSDIMQHSTLTQIFFYNCGEIEFSGC
mgnify:CR=1 FL=1